MYSFRGARRPIASSLPGRTSVATAGRGNGGAARPRAQLQDADPERAAEEESGETMECRVTAVIDPSSFWAQVGNGRRASFNIRPTCALVRWDGIANIFLAMLRRCLINIRLVSDVTARILLPCEF